MHGAPTCAQELKYTLLISARLTAPDALGSEIPPAPVPESGRITWTPSTTTLGEDAGHQPITRVGPNMRESKAVHTYEGTETIQTLLVGRAITGHAAFA